MRGFESTNRASLAACAMLAALLATPTVAFSQSLKDQVVGAWRVVSLYNEDKGNKTYPYGEKPLGVFIYDRSGNVSQFLSKPGLPKFATANRLKGTDMEYRDIGLGSLAGIGTYTIEGDTVVIKWVASTYPNRAGTTEKRVYKISGDELISVNATASAGGTSYAKYVRAK